MFEKCFSFKHFMISPSYCEDFPCVYQSNKECLGNGLLLDKASNLKILPLTLGQNDDKSYIYNGVNENNNQINLFCLIN